MGSKAWSVRVWGVRGSHPVPQKEFFGYGGNTSCISLESGEKRIIFDGGSGLIPLGDELNRMEEIKEIHLLISHAHIDHVIGLLGFKPFWDKGKRIHLYGSEREGIPFAQQLERLMGKPFWPLGLLDFRADIRVHEVKAGDSFFLGESSQRVNVGTFLGRHPGGSTLYRLDMDGKRFVYGLDCDPDQELIPSFRDFARNADLMVWDASFAPGDKKEGWGHSTWEEGIRFRRSAGIRRMLMAHYSREYSDKFLEKQEELMRERDEGSLFAREGMKLLL